MTRGCLSAALTVGVFLGLAPSTCATGEARERPPAVAGRFYSDNAARLEAGVRAFLRDALPPRGARPLGLVAPHAGYIYSGQIAADAYRQAMDHQYDLVVILGTNHTSPEFSGVSVHTGSGFRTPLGLAEIDRQAAAALIAAGRDFSFEPGVHAAEHSVEVQVPFVQVALPGVKILPAVVGAADPGLCDRLGRALARVLEGRRALVVASSDLSHYPSREDAAVADGAVLSAIAKLDTEGLRAAIRGQMGRGRPGLSTCACGEAPIMAAMAAARAMGARRGIVVSYANSGDTSVGEPSRVVGYGSVVFTAGDEGPDVSALQPPAPPPAAASLGAAEKDALLHFARETIRRFFATETTPLARGLAPALSTRQGAFVTLKKRGQLRGCIGHMAEDTPLAQVVGAMAMQAAFGDQRFQPLAPEELPEVQIEVSVLTPRKRVPGPQAIVIGRDGVTLRKSGHSAVFLPQVPVEQDWTRDETLDQLCRKADLPSDCWRLGAEFHTFQAEVFHEGGSH